MTDKPYRARLMALTAQPPPSWSAVADRAAVVLRALVDRARWWRPGWRRRPYLALVAAPRELVGALAPLADCDVFAGPRLVEQATAPELGGNERWPGSSPRPAVGEQLPFSLLAKLDPCRGGYDAVVGRARNLDDLQSETMGALEADWPGRAIAVVAAEGATSEPAALSQLQDLGIRIVRARGAEWDEAARALVEVARGTGA